MQLRGHDRAPATPSRSTTHLEPGRLARSRRVARRRSPRARRWTSSRSPRKKRQEVDALRGRGRAAASATSTRRSSREIELVHEVDGPRSVRGGDPARDRAVGDEVLPGQRDALGRARRWSTTATGSCAGRPAVRGRGRGRSSTGPYRRPDVLDRAEQDVRAQRERIGSGGEADASSGRAPRPRVQSRVTRSGTHQRRKYSRQPRQ